MLPFARARRRGPLSRRAALGWLFGTSTELAGALLAAGCVPSSSMSAGRAPRAQATRGAISSTPEASALVRAATAEPRTTPGGPSQAVRTPVIPTSVSLATPSTTPPATRQDRTPGPAEARTPIAVSGQPRAPRATPQATPGPGGDVHLHPEVGGAVRFSHCWDGPRTALVETLLSDFRARYPRIAVESEVGDSATLRDWQVTALASGNPPNVMMVRADSLAYFADREALLPLDDLLARDGIAASRFLPGEIAHGTWEDRVFGLPHTAGGADHLLYLNVGLLQRIGLDPATPVQSWQDLEGLVEPARKAGLLVLDPTRMAVGTTAHQVWTYANGGRYWDDNVRRIGWVTPPGLEAATWLLGFAKAQGLTSSADGQGGPPGPLRADEWAAERHLCCVNGVGWLYELRQQAASLRYAVFPFPRNAEHPASPGATPATGSWLLAIPHAAHDREAAWEWVKHATLSRTACELTVRQGRPSPLADCDDGAGLPNREPHWPVISSSQSAAVAVPASPLQPQLEQIAQQMQVDILAERHAPADALQSAALDAQQLLDAWNSTRPKDSRGA
ncbi:MAG: extracellular solute-binding protein [Chloroflexota bacterium]